VQSADPVYAQIVDGLRLAASRYKTQRDVLPEFVHLPDEVLLAVDFAYLPQLEAAGLVREKAKRAFADYDSYVNSRSPNLD